MTILCSLVSRGTTILARYESCLGNFHEVTELFLKQIPQEDSKLTYSQENYLFHYISENSIIYMCITGDEFERSKAFLFLNVIKKRFQSMYGHRALTAIAYSMNSEFSRILENEAKYYSCAKDIDNISRVHGQLDELKDIMVENIDSVVSRGEKIQLLINKAENLTNNAVSFRQSSRTLARTFFWKRVTFYVVCAVLCVIVLYILISMACGGLAWQSCVR